MAGIIFAFIIVLAVILGVGVPVAMGIYVYNDAKKREMNALVWTLLVILIPGFIGLIVYLIVRNEHSALNCPRCGRNVAAHFSVCPECGHSLKPVCPVCGKPVSRDWNICPHCATAIPESMRVENPVKSKGDRGLKALIAAVIIIPVLLGILLVCAVVLMFTRNVNTDTVTAEPQISFEVNESYACVEIDIEGYEEEIKGAKIVFYTNGKQLHATGTAIPADNGQRFEKTVLLDYLPDQVADSEYIIVSVLNGNEEVVASSERILLTDENGEFDMLIELDLQENILVRTD